MSELPRRLWKAVTGKVDDAAIWLSQHRHTGMAWFLWKMFRLV